MTTTFDLAEAEIDFSIGSEANWNGFQLPIPSSIVVLTTDTLKFKQGTGSKKYSELPNGPSIAGIASGEANTVNVLTALLPGDSDSILKINNQIYKPSGTTITSVSSRIAAITAKDNIQNSNLSTISSQFGMVDQSITAGDNGKLVQINNHKMKPGILPSSLAVTVPASPIILESVTIYSDKACTVPSSGLNGGGTHYVKIVATHDTADTDSLSFTLSDTNTYTTITAVGRGIFKVTVAQHPVSGNVTLNAGVSYNTDTAAQSITVALHSAILVCIYGGSGNDRFDAITTDISDNIICCGMTMSEGQGGSTYGDGLVVKFDSNLNILARKVYGGSLDEIFYGVAIDSLGNIICAGTTVTEGVGISTLVVKFDSNLNILAKKYYGGSGNDQFDAITTDISDNIICCGMTMSEGQGGSTYGDGLVVKFDSNLNILARKVYGGTSDDILVGVVADTSGNIICVGYTNSESAAGGNPTYTDALIVKFDSSLNILSRKVYGGSTGNEVFSGVAIDSSGNIICAGYTASEGAGNNDCLVVKFDPTLTILARKIYGGSTGNEFFLSVKADSSGNIICVGNDSTEGYGTDALIIKFDTNLNIIFKKYYGGIGIESFAGVAIDSSGNIVCAGYTTSAGNGSNDTLVVKFASTIPSGTFSNSVYNGLTLADSNLTLANSALTLANSNLTLINSTTTLANSSMTLANSALTQLFDTIMA